MLVAYEKKKALKVNRTIDARRREISVLNFNNLASFPKVYIS